VIRAQQPWLNTAIQGYKPSSIFPSALSLSLFSLRTPSHLFMFFRAFSLALLLCLLVAALGYVPQTPPPVSQVKVAASSVDDSSVANDVRKITSLPGDLNGFIEEQIAGNTVTIFSKSYCPFCMRTKALATSPSFTEILPTGLSSITVIELDELDGGADLQEALLEKTGQRTVPNVFVGGQHVGGNDDFTKKVSFTMSAKF